MLTEQKIFETRFKVASTGGGDEKPAKPPVDAEEQEENEKDDSDRIFKIVVCGDGSSGKTSICSRFSHDHFDKNYHQTLGLDFFSRRLGLPGEVQVLLQVWDIGGQSIAGEMLEKYVYGANAALVVYDVTNSGSFEDVSDWVNAIKRITKQQEKPPRLALVGNKTDLEHRRVIRIDKHNKFADEHGMTSFYVSAKTGDSVTLMFRQIAADLVGVALSKTDVESDIVIVEGEVTKEENPVKRRVVDQSKNTAVCSIQ
ncbi:unnamed protein product, partial [Mesorhabditis belari]|uniref:Ras-related protein Rab-28 n=1 Tax=Mesorhabditis belari TaxID=2138241 RepID=A0AAF3FEC3_9BILA